MDSTSQFRNREIFLSTSIVVDTGKYPTTERDGSLVIFVHERTAALDAAIAKHLANGSYAIQDWVAAYKTLRQMMYQAKG